MRTRTLVTLLSLTCMFGLSACDEKKADAKKADAKKADAKKGDAKKTDANNGDAAPADAKPDGATKSDTKPDGDEFEVKPEAGSAAVETLELETLGLKGMAPPDSKVGDAVVSGGVLIQGSTMVATVEDASESHPKTEDDAKKATATYKPKNLKSEALEDGWAVTFDNETPLGTNYFVQVRRELGGKSYWCEATVSKPEQQTNALAFCKSLER